MRGVHKGGYVAYGHFLYSSRGTAVQGGLDAAAHGIQHYFIRGVQGQPQFGYGAGGADGAVNAHIQVGIGIGVEDAGICIGRDRVAQNGAEHGLVAAGLLHEEGADDIQVIAHVVQTLAHGLAGQLLAGRIKYAAGFAGGVQVYGVHG